MFSSTFIACTSRQINKMLEQQGDLYSVFVSLPGEGSSFWGHLAASLKVLEVKMVIGKILGTFATRPRLPLSWVGYLGSKPCSEKYSLGVPVMFFFVWKGIWFDLHLYYRCGTKKNQASNQYQKMYQCTYVPLNLCSFRVMFYGFYQGKSPLKNHHMGNMFGFFSKHRTSKSK